MPAQARDMAQEAWMRLIRQAADHKLDRLQLPGLVIRQALFLARTFARKDPPPTDAVMVDDVEPSVEQRFLSAERLAHATSVVATLHPSAQRVFQMVYAQSSMSHADIAAHLGLSVQRVRQIVCEVRKKLRGSLEGELDA
jgi:RNA polymerase sigma-70 factor (ECF subfamily)